LDVKELGGQDLDSLSPLQAIVPWGQRLHSSLEGQEEQAKSSALLLCTGRAGTAQDPELTQNQLRVELNILLFPQL